jgi:hypothetical protein
MPSRSIFAKLRDFFSARTAVRARREHPLFRASVVKASEVYAETPLDRFIDSDIQKELARELYLELNEICSAADPKAVCREKLVHSMLGFAPLQVLMIPPPPSADDSGLRKLPGITGELQTRLDQIIRSGVFPQTEDKVDLQVSADDSGWSVLQAAYWKAYWFLETFNAVRIELGDTIPSADWYRPFMHAVCVNQEHLYRQELNLPPAFEAEVAQTIVTAFSIYTDVVVSGARDPDREWQDYCSGMGISTSDRGALPPS